MLKRFSTAVLLIMISGWLASQNLVNNPGFEEYKGKGFCYSNDVSKAVNWTGLNTADYFNSSDKVRHNYEYRKQLVFLFKSHTGDAYAGIRIQKQYKEFIQTRLREALQEGQEYEISWYTCLSEHCLYQLETLGFSLTTEDIVLKDINRKTAYVSLPLPLDSIGNNEWYMVKTTYTAKGGEQYLTIGNFNPNQKKEMIFRSEVKILSDYLYKKFKKSRESYYYLDDISVIKKEKAVSEKKTYILQEAGEKFFSDEFLQEEAIKEGGSYILQNIFFEFNESKLMDISFAELESLSRFLQNRPSMKIMIIGHTDNIGSDSYNLDLSMRRAEAVADYLTKSGINSTRLSWKGMGSQQPVAGNDTEAGRKQNRRVEFIIIHD